MIYYYSGLPYSEELYHHGIKGQKWGVRRFQNTDGSLTPAGRARYYGEEATKRIGSYLSSAAKKTSNMAMKAGSALKKKMITSIKKRHPSLMTDQELIEYKKRLDLERSYKDAVADMKSKRFSSRTIAAVEDIMKKSATRFGEKLATDAGSAIAKRMFQTKSDKLKEENAIMRERINLINNRNDLRESRDREANLRDTDRRTSVNQTAERMQRNVSDYNATHRENTAADRAYNRAADVRINASQRESERLSRRIANRTERMRNRSVTNENNNRATNRQPQQDQPREDTRRYTVNGTGYRSKARRRHGS